MPINWSLLSDAFREFDRLQQELDRLFELTRPFSPIRSVARGSFPVINIGETNDNVLVYIFAPGINLEKVDLSIEGNLLSISGERDASEALKLENIEPERYDRQERFSGKFTRVISLPESIDPNQVEATYQNGIIKVKIGKKEEKKARRIQVKAS